MRCGKRLGQCGSSFRIPGSNQPARAVAFSYSGHAERDRARFPWPYPSDKIEWTATTSYVRTLEGGSAALLLWPGPTRDGTRTVSIASVVWGRGAAVAGDAVVAVEFTYAGFVLGALDTLDACLSNQRWCMLLDQHAGVVAVSSSKLTHSR